MYSKRCYEMVPHILQLESRCSSCLSSVIIIPPSRKEAFSLLCNQKTQGWWWLRHKYYIPRKEITSLPELFMIMTSSLSHSQAIQEYDKRRRKSEEIQSKKENERTVQEEHDRTLVRQSVRETIRKQNWYIVYCYLCHLSFLKYTLLHCLTLLPRQWMGSETTTESEWGLHYVWTKG